MATTEEKLEQAEKAYHDLMMGKSLVEFRDSNGELVRYTPANAGRLAAYISGLKAELGLSVTSPLRVWS